MKLIFVSCLIFLVGVSLAGEITHSRGCIYALGKCIRECEVGTHSYGTGCDYKMPEATCDNPNPVLDTSGKICDYSACYCDPPTVRDTATGNCVALEDCTDYCE